MKALQMEVHDFHKVNLVTTAKGDYYTCRSCGASGYRAGLEGIVIVSEADYKKSLKCEFAKTAKTNLENNLPDEVLVEDLPNLGIKAGIHKVVPCPDEYKSKYSTDVWIYSESRKEPVRLFPNEYVKQ